MTELTKTQYENMMKAFDKLKASENDCVINKPITVEVIQKMVGDALCIEVLPKQTE